MTKTSLQYIEQSSSLGPFLKPVPVEEFVQLARQKHWVNGQHIPVNPTMLVEPLQEWWGNSNDVNCYGLIKWLEQQQLVAGTLKCAAARQQRTGYQTVAGEEVLKDTTRTITRIQWITAKVSARNAIEAVVDDGYHTVHMTNHVIIVRNRQDQVVHMSVRIIDNGRYYWHAYSGLFSKATPVPKNMLVASLGESNEISLTAWPKGEASSDVWRTLQDKIFPEHTYYRLRKEKDESLGNSSNEYAQAMELLKVCRVIGNRLKALYAQYRRGAKVLNLLPLDFWPVFQHMLSVADQCEGLPEAGAERIEKAREIADYLEQIVIAEAQKNKNHCVGCGDPLGPKQKDPEPVMH